MIKTIGKRLFPEKGRVFLSFFLPMALFLLLCAVIGVRPFGQNNLLVQDMYNQYADYLSYLRSIASGENNFIYTFSKALGGDMIGFSAYYLLSPFNLLFLLFDNENYSFCLTIVLALKIGLAGFTAGLYFDGIGKRGGYRYLIFSTAYALMSYTLIYASNLMWLDGVIVLPLVMRGICLLLEERKPLLYILALAYALITNYYIGYMICIFSVLYFLLGVLLEKRRIDMLFWSDVLSFFLASLAAGALAAFVLLPTFLSLEGTKAAFSPELLTFTPNFSLVDFTERLFFGSIDYADLQYGLPNVFCGTMTALCLPLFFLNKGIMRREKLLSLGVWMLLLLSMWLTAPNLIWHGFNAPVWFPYRYSFVVSFFALHCAWRALEQPGETLGGVFGLLGGTALLLALLVVAFIGTAMSAWTILLNALLILAAFIGLWWLKKAKHEQRRWAFLLLAMVQLCSLTLEGLGMEKLLWHTASSFSDYEALQMNEIRHHSADSYKSYIYTVEDKIDSIKETDEGFFRVEKTFSRTANDSMQFAYNGLSHFSSTHKTDTKYILRDYGYFATGFADYYGKGSTMAMDSFLGVKYLITDERGTARPYDSLGGGIYRNPYALPMAYAVAEDALGATWSEENPFEYQNELFAAAAGVQSIYTPITDIEILYENATVLMTDEMLRFEREEGAEESFVSFCFTAPGDELIYGSFYSPVMRNAELLLNGEPLGEAVRYLQGDIFCLGSFEAGEEVTLSLRLIDDAISISRYLLASESCSGVEAVYAALSPTADESVERQSSSRILWQGSVEAGQGALLLTVPYEENWKAWVDGEETETVSVLGGLTAVPVAQGEHSVELRYVPRGLGLGIGISVAAALALALYLLMSRTKKQRITEDEAWTTQVQSSS